MLQLELNAAVDLERPGFFIEEFGGSNCNCEHPLAPFHLFVVCGESGCLPPTAECNPGELKGSLCCSPRPLPGSHDLKQLRGELGVPAERPVVVALQVVARQRHSLDCGRGTCSQRRLRTGSTV